MSIINSIPANARFAEAPISPTKNSPNPFISAITTIAIGALATLGTAMLLSGISTGIIPLVIAGGCVIAATIALIAVRRFHPYFQDNKDARNPPQNPPLDPPVEALKKPLDFVAETESFITNKPAVKKIKKILSRQPIDCSCNPHCSIAVKHARHNHLLHDHITAITKDDILPSSDAKLKTLWKQFLESLHHLPVHYPDGGTLQLDFSPEIASMGTDPYVKKIEIEQTHAKSLTQKDLEQIYAIDRESFEAKPKHAINFWNWQNEKNAQVILARDSKSKQIEGMISYHEESPKVVHITSVARRANAAKIGVANKMFTHFFANVVKEKHPGLIKLNVRISNKPAIKLYESQGFNTTALVKKYYSNPNEDSYLMHWKPSS